MKEFAKSHCVLAVMMQEKNPNLFPIIAVLTAASILTGICGLLFLAIDQIGGARVLSTPLGQSLEGKVAQAGTLAEGSLAEGQSLQSPSQIIGQHDATVLNIEAINPDKNDPQQNDASFWIASGSYDNTATVWKMSEPNTAEDASQKNEAAAAELVSLEHSGRVNALTFVPDNPFIADAISTQSTKDSSDKDSQAKKVGLVTGSGSGEIKLWSLPKGDAIATVADKAGRVVSLAMSADGQTFASGTSQGTLKVWPTAEVAAQKSQTNLRGVALNQEGPQVNALAFHPTENTILVSGDEDGNVRVWDIEQGTAIFTLSSDAERIVSLAISLDGRYVASGSHDNLIRIWNLETGQLARTLSGHGLVVSDVAFSPDGSLLASSSYDESIKTWDWATATQLCTLTGHEGFVKTVSFVGDRTLVSAGYDGTVRSWDLTSSTNRDCLK